MLAWPGCSPPPAPRSQLRKWIRNLEAETQPEGAKPKKAKEGAAASRPKPQTPNAEPKPKKRKTTPAAPAPPPPEASEPDDEETRVQLQAAAASAGLRTPRRAAAAARLRVQVDADAAGREDEEDEEDPSAETDGDDDDDDDDGDGSDDATDEMMDESELDVGDGSAAGGSMRGSPPVTPQAPEPFSAAADARRAARRASSSRTPDKVLGGAVGSPTSPLQMNDPIIRRAASSRPRSLLSLGARAGGQPPVATSTGTPLFLLGRGGPASQWFLPVDGGASGLGVVGGLCVVGGLGGLGGAADGINVSPQGWVDEWLSEVASDAASELGA